MKINWQPFFEKPDNSGGTVTLEKPDTIKPEKSDDDTSLLDGLIGDKDLLDMDEQESKSDKEDEDKEEVKLEEDDNLIEEEPDTNTRAVDFKKIKEKYGDFAKTNEYRELKNTYYREGKYTELFPTIEDAQEAAENNDTFNKLNDDLVNKGDVNSLLAAVKEANPDSFRKITTTFIDNLARIDPNLYTEAITPIVKRMARQIYNDGKKALTRNAESVEGQALVATARNILLHFFEDANDIDKDEPQPDNGLTQKEVELQQREQRIAYQQYTEAYKVCDKSVEVNLDKAIGQGLDPDGKLNDFTRDTLIEKIKNEVKDQIGKDNLHIKKMTSLWKRASESGYNRESLSRIVSAYLERARPIIPTVRSKYRSLAIRGKSTNDDSEESPRIANRGRSGRAPSNDGKVNIRSVDSKKIDYRKTSDEDIFEGKVKIRG